MEQLKIMSQEQSLSEMLAQALAQAMQGSVSERYEEQGGLEKRTYVFSADCNPKGEVCLVDDYRGEATVPFPYCVSAVALIEVAQEMWANPDYALYSEDQKYHRMRSTVRWGEDSTVTTVLSVDEAGKAFFTVNSMYKGRLEDGFVITQEDFPKFIQEVKEAFPLEDSWRYEAAMDEGAPAPSFGFADMLEEARNDVRENMIKSHAEMRELVAQKQAIKEKEEAAAQAAASLPATIPDYLI